MSEEIAESLREISTPTGLSYSGDRTLNNSYTEKIIDYINSLQQKVEQLENIIKEAIEELSYMSTDAYVEDYDIREKHYNLLMNILNKGDNNGK